MIPSRGLRWSSQTIGIGRRRVEPLSSRKFSSFVQHEPIRTSPLLSTGASFTKSTTRSQFSRTNNVIRNGVSLRFASTSPTTTATSSFTPNPVSSSVAPPEFVSDFNSLTGDLPDSIYNIPESIGYLKALGLDYGWGPTAGMEWLLEHVHILAGTPWWMSIALTAILVRTALIYPYIGAADNAARMATIKHVTEPVTQRMKTAQRSSDVDGVMKARQDLNMIHKRAGVKLWRSFVPALQIFTGYGTFVILRAMSNLPVPGLETGGVLWFHNLTLPDPYLILPIATAGVLHWVLRTGGETGASTMSPEIAKAISYGLPFLSLIFTSWLSAGLQFSFFISGLLSYIQGSVFRNPSFRKWLNITPLPPNPNGGKPPSPYKGTMKLATPVPSQSPSSPVLSTSELNARFEASAPEPPTSRTRALLNKLTKPITEVADSGRALVAKGNKSMDERRAKSEIKDRERYEVKRREELKKAERERIYRRRMEREARKNKDV